MTNLDIRRSIRTVSILVIFYCTYALYSIIDAAAPIPEIRSAGETIINNIFAIPTSNNPDSHMTQAIAGAYDYQDKSLDFYLGLLDLQSTLLPLIAGIISGITFIFAPSISRLQIFAHHSSKNSF
ncbi:hypothetical protein A0U40_18425 [[Bacillus] sp. KCTC 13219]|nr:hypothetical protein A0U40_18425 [[Bacillus] sp. KCTC 13219]